MSTKRLRYWILAIGSHFGIKRDQRGQKRYYYVVCRFLIFHPIRMGFFSSHSSFKELSVVCQWIWRSSYHFRYKGSKGTNAQNNTFLFYCVQENHCVQQITVSKHISVSMRICIHTRFNLTFAPSFRVEIAGPFRQRQFRLALVYLQN